MLKSALFDITNFLGGKKLYFGALIFLSFSLPLSKFTISVSIFVLLGNWLLSGEIKKRLQQLSKQKDIIWFISIYLVHVISVLWSDDLGYALKDLRVKLPLLILPVIIGTSPKLTRKQLKIIILSFGVAAFIGAVLNTFVFFEWFGYRYTDVRDISIFISHIHFSVMISFIIYAFGYYLVSKQSAIFKHEKLLLLTIGIYLLFFLFFILKTLTGIGVFLSIGVLLALFFTFKLKNKFFRFSIWTLLVIIPVLLSLYIYHVVQTFYDIEEYDRETMDLVTANHNPYWHQFDSDDIENGNHVYLYVCEKELRKEWNQVSQYDYDGFDQRNQEIKHTLIRYLASLGYRKDSVGVSKLNQEDINMIEKGYANHIYKNRYSLYPRIYTIVWQLDRYLNGADPAGQSVSQRIESYKISMEIIRKNFWLGVGIGDVKQAFSKIYERKFGSFQKGLHIKGTNQFLTFFLTLGVFGFIIILLGLFYPVYKRRNWIDFLFIVFFITFILSLFNQNDMIFQVSITYFTFFYSLFLWGRTPPEEKSSL